MTSSAMQSKMSWSGSSFPEPTGSSKARTTSPTAGPSWRCANHETHGIEVDHFGPDFLDRHTRTGMEPVVPVARGAVGSLLGRFGRERSGAEVVSTLSANAHCCGPRTPGWECRAGPPVQVHRGEPGTGRE